MPKKETKEEQEEEKEVKKELKNEKKILPVILVILGILIAATIIFFIIAAPHSPENFTYDGINFTIQQIGNLTFYDTTTLARNYQGSPFGFRITTNPNDLKNISFYGFDNFTLMNVNVINGEGNHTFNCNGDGVIAIANLQRTFSEMGMSFIRDDNATCNTSGKYNYFKLEYGNTTEVKQVGEDCYDIIMKGNDASCEILPATEKLMVDMYAKYLGLVK